MDDDFYKDDEYIDNHLKRLTNAELDEETIDNKYVEQPRMYQTNNDFTKSVATLLNTLLQIPTEPIELSETVELLIETDIVSIVENCLIDSNVMKNICEFIMNFYTNQQQIEQCLAEYDDDDFISRKISYIHDVLYDVMKVMVLIMYIVYIMVCSFHFIDASDITSVFHTYETLNLIMPGIITDESVITSLGLSRENIKFINNQDNLWVLVDMLANDVNDGMKPLMGFIYNYLHITVGKLAKLDYIFGIVGLDISSNMLFDDDELTELFSNMANVDFNVHKDEELQSVLLGMVNSDIIDDNDNVLNPLICYIVLLVFRDHYNDINDVFGQVIENYKNVARSMLFE